MSTDLYKHIDAFLRQEYVKNMQLENEVTRMSNYQKCPHCNTDLSYTYDGNTYYRTMSVEVRGVYDGGLFYQCPDCAGRWHRWIGDDVFSKRMRAKAEMLWHEWDSRNEEL